MKILASPRVSRKRERAVKYRLRMSEGKRLVGYDNAEGKDIIGIWENAETLYR